MDIKTEKPATGFCEICGAPDCTRKHSLLDRFVNSLYQLITYLVMNKE